MQTKAAMILVTSLMLSAQTFASVECLPLLIAPQFTLKSATWVKLSSNMWSYHSLLNQPVRISAKGALGIPKVFEGVLTQVAVESFDGRGESNGHSPYKIEGEAKDIPFRSVDGVSVQVTGHVSSSVTPSFAKAWHEVPQSKWRSADLQGIPVGIFIRSELGFIQFVIAKIQTLPQEQLSGQKDRYTSPFVLENGRRVKESDIEKILLVNSPAKETDRSRYKDWHLIESMYWKSQDLVGMRVFMIFRDDTGIERSTEGVVRSVPKTTNQHQQSEPETSPYVIEGYAKPIKAEAVISIQVAP